MAEETSPVANGFSSESEETLSKKHANEDLFSIYETYQAFYKNKLEVLEANCDKANTPNKDELQCLRNYIEQLEELNSVLMNTVIELQKEVEERVVQMEKRLKSSAKTTMEAVINLHDCEKEMSRLVNERENLDSLLTDVRCQFSSMTVENNLLKDQNCNFAHDIQALLHIIQHARSTGHWEMDCVTFCEVTPEQVFGPVQSLDNFSVPNTDTVKALTVDSGSKDNKCTSNGDPSSSAESLPTCKNSFSVPMLQSGSPAANLNRKSSKSDTLCFDRTDEVFSKPFDLRHAKQHAVDKESLPSCSTAHRSCYDSFMRKAFSEPHLFIFGDNIYVYKPCETALNFLEESRNGLNGCPSMDLKLPIDSKYSRMHRKHLFYNSITHNASSLPCNMEQISLSSCTSDSVDMENSLVNESGEMEEEYLPDCCKCSPGIPRQTSSASCQIQTDKEVNCSVALQTDLPYSNENPIDPIILTKEMQTLKENLLRSEDKVCAQNILVKELQLHLNAMMGELETKDKEVTELKSVEKVLQDQKRMLMIRLDSESDELEGKKSELEAANRLLQEAITQNQQQTVIIKSLQDALVQSKRTLDERNSFINNNRHLPSGNNRKNYQSQPIQTSRSSIVDL